MEPANPSVAKQLRFALRYYRSSSASAIAALFRYIRYLTGLMARSLRIGLGWGAKQIAPIWEAYALAVEDATDDDLIARIDSDIFSLMTGYLKLKWLATVRVGFFTS